MGRRLIGPFCLVLTGMILGICLGSWINHEIQWCSDHVRLCTD